jgi:undecaprenyl-diphosphatase
MSAIFDFQQISKMKMMTLMGILLLFFIVLSVLTFSGETLKFDNQIMENVIISKETSMKLLFMGISQISLYISVIFSPIIALWYFLRNDKWKGNFILIAMGGSVIIWELFNIIILFPRPQASITLTQSYSYPSGHVLVGVCFFLSLAITTYDKTENPNIRRISWILHGIIIALISISRMYLRAHYPTDVLAGILIGSLWLIALVLYFNKIETPLNKVEATFLRRIGSFHKMQK